MQRYKKYVKNKKNMETILSNVPIQKNNKIEIMLINAF